MKKLLTLLAAIFLSTNLAQCAIKVTPVMIELDARNAKNNYMTASFSVQGDKDETIRFKVYPEFFEITNDGKMDVKENSAAPNSLVSRTRFVPNEFTVINGQPQKVRLTITDVKSLPDGESRMVLFLEDVQAKELMLPNSYKNVTTKLVVKTRVGVPVYLDKGRVSKKAEFQGLKVEKIKDELNYQVKLASLGNSKVRCSGKGQIIKGKVLISEFPLDSMVIRGGGSFEGSKLLSTDDVQEVGDYTLRVIINYKDENGRNKSLVKETLFKVDTIKPAKM